MSEAPSIPHRPPALLVERVLSSDAVGATAELTVREGPWLRAGAFAPEALVEALAQTCAVFATSATSPAAPSSASSPSASSPSGGAPGSQGVLASVSRFSFPERALPGDVVSLAVRLETRLGPLAAFEGVARVGEREVARGELRVAVVSPS